MAKVLTPQLLRRIVLEEKAKIEKETKLAKMGKVKPVEEADKPRVLKGPEDYADTVPHAKKHLDEIAALNEVESELVKKLSRVREHRNLAKKKFINSL